MALMDETDAFKLIEDIVYANKDNFMAIDKFLEHTYATGQRAREYARKLSLDERHLTIAGYLHDIGRCLTKDKEHHIFHEALGARYIQDNGLKLGIADTVQEIVLVAQSFRSHYVIYEQSQMKEFDVWWDDLADTDSSLLLPKSWNELVIMYADLTNINGNYISFENRIEDNMERDKRTGNYPRLAALQIALPRLETMVGDLRTALQNGGVNAKYTI